MRGVSTRQVSVSCSQEGRYAGLQPQIQREEGRRSGRGVCIQGSDIQGATAKMTFSVDHGFSAFENG